MSSPVDPVTEVEPAEADLPETAQNPESTSAKQSHIISKVLSPAVRLWLRSQLEQAEDLQLKIEAGDRQLLSGAISRVSISARHAVYRGLHLSQVDLTGEQIRTNLRQVLRGKPFRLLEAFPVAGQVLLQEADLNTSLQAPLLANAVIDFLLTLLKSDLEADNSITDGQLTLQDPQVVLNSGQLTLIANLLSASGKTTPVVIRTGLRVENGHKLMLDRPQWLPHAKARQGLPLQDLDGFTIDLGPQVCLEALTLEAGQIVCRGQIWVTPEA